MLATHMQKIAATNPQQITAAAQRLAQTVEPLISQVAGVTFNQDLVTTLLQNIAADGESLATRSVRVAEQTAMAVDALVMAYKAHATRADIKSVEDAVQGLFQSLEKLDHYDPQAFSRHMGVIHAFFKK